MLKISVTELKRNFDKYIALGQKEEIIVTYRGKDIFTIVPQKIDLLKILELYSNLLPEEAISKHNEKEIDRE